MEENLPTKDKIISASLNNLKKLVIHFANIGTNILLSGPRGSGKELFARLYQEETGREKFAPINCSGIGDSALISELFGHVKGSFTDAIIDRPGLLPEYAKNGVIFLDEIGDASQNFQAAILRVLQTGDYKKLGSDEIITIEPREMRIIAATTRIENLRMELKDRFATLYVPGLPVLIAFGDLPDFIKAFFQNTEVEYISQQALKILQTHDWPGNVRELKTVLDVAIILGNSKEITVDDLPTLRVDRDDYRSYIDNSERIKLSDLISRSEIPPSNFFFNPWRAGKEEPTPAEIEKLTMLSRLDSISNGLRGIEGAIHNISRSESKKPSTERIDFENTLPDEYNKRFWEHHVEEGRGGTKLAELFQGKIKPKTASANLQKAKERLIKSKGVESDK